MILRLIFISLFILLIPSPGTSQHDDIRKQIDKLIRYETGIDYTRTPGFIVGMLDGDSTYILSFGKRSLEENAPISMNDLFELGGITKLFTAMITLDLIRENKLDLYHSVNEYLPFKNPDFDSCTIFRLLSHTSGLPKYPAGWGSLEQDSQDPYAAFGQSDLEAFFKNYKMDPKPKNVYLYSHLNYVLLEWALESISHLKYDQLLTKYLPDHIQVSLLNPPTIPGYGLNMKPVHPWTMSVYGASVGLKGSLQDLLNTCNYFLKSPSPYSSMLNTFPSKIRKESASVAMGWQAVPISKNRFLFAHTGRTKGYHSFISILPETKTGVVVLSNSAAGSDVLGISILNMMNKNWKRK